MKKRGQISRVLLIWPYFYACGHSDEDLQSSLFAPSAGCTAGENKAAFCDGKTDFISLCLSAKSFYDSAVYHIREYTGLQSGGVGIDQVEDRIV